VPITISSLSLRPRLRAARLVLVCVVVLGTSACGPSNGNPKVPAGAKSSGGLHAAIETDKGTIEIEFLSTDAPKATENFRLLAEHGYYDGLTFHRIVKHFMIQGGDPAGDGTGGQSAWGPPFEDEIKADSSLYSGGYRRGFVAMANQGPNTNGSQFFIMHENYPLPPNYVIFARVTGGLDVVDALANTPTTRGSDGQMSKPTVTPVIKKVTIRP
jgi:cyclophilin family peptidyl-prolyl cis-trans isomerase